MRYNQIVQIFGLIILLFFACENDPLNYDNPNDPLSNNFVAVSDTLVSRSIILLEDFDDADSINVWGYPTDIYFETGGGKITRSWPCNQSRTGNGCVIQLDYNVNMSQGNVGWGQLVGAPDSNTGFFNAKAMGLKYFSFWVKGASSGEEFFMGFTDGDGVSTDPSKRIYVNDIIGQVTTDWKKVRIPLQSFLPATGGNQINLTKLHFFDLNLLNGFGPTQGRIFIDDIAFER